MSPEDLALAEIASAHDGVFTLGDAEEAGLSRRQVRLRARSAWVRLYPGVFRVPGAPRTWSGDLRAACFAGEPNAVVSHRSAAKIYDLPGGRCDLVEMTCPRWRRSQTAGLVVHESTFVHPNDVQLVDDLPVMRPERVVFELASRYPSPDFLERVLHAARRKRLITFESTMRVFDRLAGRGRHGVVAFRLALERWEALGAAHTESEMETLLVQVLRRRGLPLPVLQYEVFDANRRFVARVDAAYPDHKVVIEYDSEQEHSDEWATARDSTRRMRLLALGYVPLSVRHQDLMRGGAQLAAAIRACLRRPA